VGEKRLMEEVLSLLFVMAFEEVSALLGGFRSFLIKEVDSLSLDVCQGAVKAPALRAPS
jgi:hypothetical protein